MSQGSKEKIMVVAGQVFNRTKFNLGFDSQPCIAWTEECAPDETGAVASNPLTFTILKTGFSQHGALHTVVCTNDEYKEFAALMVEIWRDRMSLQPNLVSTLSGH